MSFFERLSALISEKNLTFRKVERDCGLANATIRRWETQSPRLESVIAVANYLHVSIDYLALGVCENTTEEVVSASIEQTEVLKEKNRLACDGSPLEDEEADLVAMYRLLPDHKKEDAFDIICTLYQKHVERKKESIYWTYKADKLKRKATDADSDLSGSGQGGIA